jgi:hypothetical protein
MEEERLIRTVLDTATSHDDALGMIYSNYIDIGGDLVGLTVARAVEASKAVQSYERIRDMRIGMRAIDSGVARIHPEVSEAPKTVMALFKALAEIGIKVYLGPVHWADGDVGYNIAVGEFKDKVYGYKPGDSTTLVEVGDTTSPLFTMSFRSDGTLRDYEGENKVMEFNVPAEPADTQDHS